MCIVIVIKTICDIIYRISNSICHIINGILWGAIAGLCAWGLYWDAPEGRMLGLVMFLAMLLNIIQGAVVGLAVPLILRYFGRDPAMGGSVLLTFTTDSGGFLIFLGLATFFFAS